MDDVFISYKRRFKPRVDILAEKLRALGLTVWYDADLEPGHSYGDEINDKLDAAKAVVVCWSPDCFKRGGDTEGWVTGEARRGRQAGKLVALAFEACELDAPFNNDHVEDMTTWNGEDDKAYRKLLARIGALCDRKGLAEYPGPAAAPDRLLKWAAQFPSDPLAMAASAAATAARAAEREAVAREWKAERARQQRVEGEFKARLADLNAALEAPAPEDDDLAGLRWRHNEREREDVRVGLRDVQNRHQAANAGFKSRLAGLDSTSKPLDGPTPPGPDQGSRPPNAVRRSKAGLRIALFIASTIIYIVTSLTIFALGDATHTDIAIIAIAISILCTCGYCAFKIEHLFSRASSDYSDKMALFRNRPTYVNFIDNVNNRKRRQDISFLAIIFICTFLIQSFIVNILIAPILSPVIPRFNDSVIAAFVGYIYIAPVVVLTYVTAIQRGLALPNHRRGPIEPLGPTN